MAATVNRRPHPIGPCPEVDEAMRIIEADLARGINISIRESGPGLYAGRMWEPWPAEAGPPPPGWWDPEITAVAPTPERVIRELAAILKDTRLPGDR